MCICEWRGERFAHCSSINAVFRIQSCHFWLSKQNNSSVPFLHTGNMYVAYKSRKKQIQFFARAPFPSAHHLQHWITSTFYVMTSEDESVPLWQTEESTINSYEAAFMSSHYESDIFSSSYFIDPSYILYDGGYMRKSSPHGTNYPCNYDILCLSQHKLCTHFSWLPLEQLLSSGSSSAYHSAVQQKLLECFFKLSCTPKWWGSQWWSGFKVDVHEYEWATQGLPLPPRAPRTPTASHSP